MKGEQSERLSSAKNWIHIYFAETNGQKTISAGFEWLIATVQMPVFANLHFPDFFWKMPTFEWQTSDRTLFVPVVMVAEFRVDETVSELTSNSGLEYSSPWTLVRGLGVPSGRLLAACPCAKSGPCWSNGSSLKFIAVGFWRTLNDCFENNPGSGDDLAPTSSFIHSSDHSRLITKYSQRQDLS